MSDTLHAIFEAVLPGVQEIHFSLLSSAGVGVKCVHSMLVLLQEGSTSQAGAGCFRSSC